MKEGHVTAKGVWNGERVVFDNDAFVLTRLGKQFGVGETVIARFESEAEAKRYHRLKWYFGYVVKQCCDKTGYAVPEMDLMFRALFMPGDVETLHLMSDEQMRDFNLQCEQYAAEVIGVVVVGPRDRFLAA